MAQKAVSKEQRRVMASVMTEKDADEFREAAAEYGKKHTATKAAARKKLQELGIYTADGSLTKRYR